MEVKWSWHRWIHLWVGRASGHLAVSEWSFDPRCQCRRAGLTTELPPPSPSPHVGNEYVHVAMWQQARGQISIGTSPIQHMNGREGFKMFTIYAEYDMTGMWWNIYVRARFPSIEVDTVPITMTYHSELKYSLRLSVSGTIPQTDQVTDTNIHSKEGRMCILSLVYQLHLNMLYGQNMLYGPRNKPTFPSTFACYHLCITLNIHVNDDEHLCPAHPKQSG